MDDFRSALKHTVDAFLLHNIFAVQDKDPTLFSAVLTEDCIRMYRRSSSFNDTRSSPRLRSQKTEYDAQVKTQVHANVSHNITKTFIHTTERRATLHSKQTVVTDGSNTIIEVIWGLYFTRDGMKISQTMEFVDTYKPVEVTEEMLSKLAVE
ncbi:hypothetical protein HD806DRAFT_479724 [Xylariaceae sp. AK1471]|nr:hypothetical protein HD806DRAFT_479724 [Xylariaceae sp. AK1471]